MTYRLTTLRDAADDLAEIITPLKTGSPENRRKLHQLSAELDLAAKQIQEFPFSFQEISAGVFRIPLVASRLYVYYRVLVRDVTIVAIRPQPMGNDVATSRDHWPESVRQSLSHLTWLPRLGKPTLVSNSQN